jgi:ParB family transcriptional regulator, chromosome partitioning protein
VAVSNLIRLLDLPDEALALIEAGDLSEGHGRALLTATDHDDRRRLARAAVDARWSVRELEDRARRTNGPGSATGRRTKPRRRLHPDQEAAAVQINDALGSALGREVDVTPTAAGGYRVHLSFSSTDEALDLAHRLSSGQD